MNLQCGNRTLNLEIPQVMGILNVTPDSFSDGGRFSDLDRALYHAEKMISDGASIIDIGGESTRPGAQPVTITQELDRVIPVIEALSQRFEVVVSVDTSTPEVMTQAAAVGVNIINDVRSLTREGALKAAAETGLPICLMHMNGEPQVMQNNPQYSVPVEQAVLAQLAESIERCEQAGIERSRLIVDPGFGFGKNNQHDYRLLNRLETLQTLKLPILTGLSRKRMIGAATQQENAADRIIGSVSAAVICALKGARIIRVHDVKATVEAMQVVSATFKESNV